MTLEFGEPDLEGLKFPQGDPLVITMIIGNYLIIRILVDNEASVDILFHDTFIRMGYNYSQLTPSDAPIYGFNHIECKVEGALQIPVRENDELRGKPVVDLVPIPLDHLDPEKVTYIGESLDKPLKGQMITFLQENGVVFAWTAADIPGIDPNLITQRLNVDQTRKIVKHKKRTYAPGRLEAIKQEVEKLLEVGFIEEV
ncbi:uncharacterized protein LOC141695391 [Apium graveolens]|uniref:uncharacterized protein LOC141695391 n=1 Tax=Apium graveolens TaxID=4045 RepID=UPI003D7B9A8E